MTCAHMALIERERRIWTIILKNCSLSCSPSPIQSLGLQHKQMAAGVYSRGEEDTPL
jgi:hypothetical protein